MERADAAAAVACAFVALFWASAALLPFAFLVGVGAYLQHVLHP